MGTVHQLGTSRETATLGEAASAYLASLDHPESAGTRRVYGSTLRALLAEFGADGDLGSLRPAAVAAWFSRAWGDRAPATWNRNRDALRSFLAYCEAQGWLSDAAALTRGIRRRRRASDRSRALSRADVAALLAREDIALRERVLWRCSTRPRPARPRCCAWTSRTWTCRTGGRRYAAKGGAIDVDRSGRPARPGCCPGCSRAARRARVLRGRARSSCRPATSTRPAAGPGCPTGRPRRCSRTASGGATLHQLRHSALTHDAEDGASTPMLMAKSGHTSVASLARYARPSAEALGRWQASRDPARRR